MYVVRGNICTARGTNLGLWDRYSMVYVLFMRWFSFISVPAVSLVQAIFGLGNQYLARIEIIIQYL